MADEVQSCSAIPSTSYWFRSRCGRDRDCVPADNLVPFRLGYCNAIAWCRTNPGSGRFVEVWDPTNTRAMFKMTERNSTFAKQSSCIAWQQSGAPSSFTFGDAANPYTVQIPGISDILRVPGIDSPEARRQRGARMARANSGIPEQLKWIPKLLNKLDDAQDLLYTGLVIGVALLKVLGVRMFPGLGILLTVNDMLNFFG